jgi:ribosome biogenesis protein ENP2
MSMKVSTFNNVKVYDLAGAQQSVPETLSKAKKRAMAKDDEYRRRIELIQDFEMPTTAHCIKMSADGEYIMVSGGYPPMLRCFMLSDMSMKFQRGLTCHVVDMEILSDDYSKVVLLQGDRTLAFHAPYGAHYSLRVPKFGRHLAYGRENCDLYVAASGDEVYRLNLEAGQFKEPIPLSFSGCNKVCINPVHRLLACGGEGGVAEFWDARSKKTVSQQYVGQHLAESSSNVGKTSEITALTWDTDGLSLGVGTKDGNVILYDIRSSKPLLVKEHQYGVPMVDINFHNSSRHIISTDQKVAKIWQRDGDDRGAIMTNVETPADINATLVVGDRGKESGLIMMAGEQSQIMTYFVPQLGPAPRWCSFLEGLTEELEEEKTSTVYEDFKFLTKFDVEELGAASLIGTENLKAYMHGYFMDMKMYQSLRAVAKPFEFDEHRKKRINEKLEEKRQSRIVPKKKLPKVNKELAEKMMRRAEREARREGEGEGEGEEDDDDEEVEEDGEKKSKKDKASSKKAAAELVDDRFSSLFKREEFQQDPESMEFQLRNPTQSQKARRNTQHDEDEDDDLQGMYTAISDDEKGSGGYADSDSDSDDGDGDKAGGDDYDDDDNEYESDIEIHNPDAEDAGSRKRKPTPAPKKATAGGKKKKGKRGADGEDEMGAIAKASRKASQKEKERRGSSGSGSGSGSRKKPGFFEVSDTFASGGAAVSASMGMLAENHTKDKERQLRDSSTTLADRLKMQSKAGKSKITRRDGNMKEMEFMPKSSGRDSSKGGSRGKGGGGSKKGKY